MSFNGLFYRTRNTRGPDFHLMGTDLYLTFRTPLILLAMADLAILGARLWPWQDVMSLPGNGATGLDPAVSLVAYIVLGFWITNTRVAPARKSLFSAAMLGLVAGLLLAAQVMLAARPPAGDGSTATIQMVLMAAAALVCGFAGLKASRTGVSLGFSAVCAGWAAMVGCLMACAVILVQGYFAMGPPESPDPGSSTKAWPSAPRPRRRWFIRSTR